MAEKGVSAPLITVAPSVRCVIVQVPGAALPHCTDPFRYNSQFVLQAYRRTTGFQRRLSYYPPIRADVVSKSDSVSSCEYE